VHYDLFTGRNGNRSYNYKVLGSPTTKLDKCIFGALLSAIIMVLLVGPLWFFSDIGGFVAPNPVQSARLELDFIIEKKLLDFEDENKKYEKNSNDGE